VVTLAVNGGARADIEVGDSVELVGVVEAPPGGGVVVSTEWDYDGTGNYADVDSFDLTSPAVRVTRTRTFDQPGTWFVTLRATAQREEDIGSPYCRLLNLARVRVVVA
jgi:hypothetical protein